MAERVGFARNRDEPKASRVVAGNTPEPPTDEPTGEEVWRRGWDSNPRAGLPDKPLSRRPRYDHFGTSPQRQVMPQARHVFAYRSVVGSPEATRPSTLEEPLHQRPALAVEHRRRSTSTRWFSAG